jgi:regulator of sigma E protease
LEILGSFSWTIASFVVVLGIMIFVHELGHHLMAKYLGIGVKVFSLGFGPRLVGTQRGETDYRISLLPLGGYVKMAGENFNDELSGSPDEFLSRPKKQRFAVAVAGPVMNLALAVVLLAVNFMIGVQVPYHLSQPAVIGHVMNDSPAQEAGFQLGDEIVAINGRATPTWEDVQLTIATSPGQDLVITVRRAEETVDRPVRSEEHEVSGAGFIGVSASVSNTITAVEEGPASQAGLEVGDEIVKVEAAGRTATELTEIVELIAGREEKPVDFFIRRGQETFSKTIRPIQIDGKVRVGIAIASLPSQETRVEQYGVFEAFRKATERCYTLTVITFGLVGKLLTGTMSIRTMSGPIEIARFSGEAAAAGFTALLAFMSLISLQLGIFNLFPIPILDGGVIALLAIEGLMRRDLSLKAKERIFQVGFLFLVLLMSIVILNDISKNV